ncbi:PAS domain S-box protein [Azospirillum sp.]|uniref:PAS domain S-box protein n=1 Tax=Azospirillum sp. TaxID=34012 RepID=UPI002D77C754|nr:PAS domain S-box protein [Azospirillum sp.]
MPTVTETLLDSPLSGDAARWRDAADAMPGLFWQENAAGACVFVNRAWRELTGRTLAQELGQGWLSSIHPEDRLLLAGPVAAAKDARRPFDAEFRLRAADGSWRWVLGRAEPRVAADGAFLGYAGSGLDITGRKQAEIQRRAEEERYRALFAQAAIGIWRVGLDGRLLEVNDRLCALLGYHRDELVGRDFRDLVHPDDRAAEEAELARLLAGDVPSYTLERRCLHKDGSLVWVRVTSSLGSAPGRAGERFRISIIEDVTDRRAAEEALRVSEARLRRAQEAGGVGDWEMDLVAGTVIWSASLYRLLGRDPAGEAPSLGALMEVVHADDRAELGAVVDAVLRGDRPLDTEFRVLLPDGTVKWLSSRGEVERDALGRPVRLVGVNFDVTARKQAECRTRFLAELHDALRPLSDPRDVLAEASAAVGRYLRVGRAGFAEVEGDAERLHVSQDWCDGMASAVGIHATSACGEAALALLRAGLPLVVEDVAADPRTAPAAAGYSALEIGALAELPIMRDGRLVGLLFAHDRAPRRWAAEDVVVLGQVAERAWAAVERARAEAALRMSEQRLRVTYDNAFAGFAELDLDGRVLNANLRLAEILGYSHAEVLSMSLLSVTDARDADADAACFRRMVAGEIDSYQLEKRVTRKDGRPLWVALAASLVRDADQKPLYSVRVIVDITELKAAEDQRKLLLGELNHRVKNTLAIVQSIAAQTQRGAASAEQFVQAFDARLLALSQAHNLLTRESWQGADLDDLLRETLRPYGVGEAGARVSLSGPAVRVGPAAAVAIGMAFHELATNAAKYGALSNGAGRVGVVWRVEPAEDGPDRLVIAWTESGGPPVVPPTRRGFGSRMIERGLSGQLECAVELTFPPDGVRCRIAVPLSTRVLTA